MPDLWPADIGTTELIPPVTILKEQASLLGEKTKHLVEGRVVALGRRARLPPGDFGYAFFLVAPALGGYRYRLLDVFYRAEFYPITIRVDEDVLPDISPQYVLEGAHVRERVKAQDEKALKEILAAVFGAAKTRRVIAAIVAQSTS